MAREITKCLDAAESAPFQKRPYLESLFAAMLQRQCPAWRQHTGRGLDDLAQALEPVRAAIERLTGFVTQVAGEQRRIVGSHVGRIDGDEIEPGVGKGAEPVRPDPIDVKPEARAVGDGDLECPGTAVHGDHSAAGTVMLDGERDSPAAGAGVEHGGALPGR